MAKKSCKRIVTSSSEFHRLDSNLPRYAKNKSGCTLFCRRRMKEARSLCNRASLFVSSAKMMFVLTSPAG